MSGFLLYLIKASAVLAVFYMCYRLLLSRESFHRINRIVLLATAAASFVLPLCVITVVRQVPVPQGPAILSGVQDTAGLTAAPGMPLWQIVAATVYIAGIVICLSITALSVFRTRRMIAEGADVTEEFSEMLPGNGRNIKVVVTSEDVPPFSWMKYIVLPAEDYEKGNRAVILHEYAHIRMRHSWDVMFAEILTAFDWFNLAVWMMKADLRAIHEYEADDSVLSSGVNLRDYQYLLIKKAVGMSGHSVANSFNHSILKNRITMMSKKSDSRALLKALYVIPLVGISLAASANVRTEFVPASKEQDNGSKVIESLENRQDTVSVKEEVICYVDGEKVSGKILESIDASKIESVSVFKDRKPAEIHLSLKKGQDTVMAVKTNGKVSGIRITNNGKPSECVSICNIKIGNDSEADKAKTGGPEIYIDGRKVTEKEMNALDPKKIKSVDVVKDKEGEGKGIIRITTKSE